MRKSLIFALLTLLTLSMVMVSCDNNNNPNPPENRGRNIVYDIQITCTCGNEFRLYTGVDVQLQEAEVVDYKVYALGYSPCDGSLTLKNQGKYPFVIYQGYESYYFWRCKCGRYHKVMMDNLTHTEIPSGQQPDKWNEFNYLWEQEATENNNNNDPNVPENVSEPFSLD